MVTLMSSCLQPLSQRDALARVSLESNWSKLSARELLNALKANVVVDDHEQNIRYLEQ